jgi:hypothetical protein
LCGDRCSSSLLSNQNRPIVDWMDESTDLPGVRDNRLLDRIGRVRICVETDAPVLCFRIRIARLLVGWMNRPISRVLEFLDRLAEWLGFGMVWRQMLPFFLSDQNRPHVDWMDESTDLPEVRVTRFLGRVVRVRICAETDASHPALCCRIRNARLLIGWIIRPIPQRLWLLDFLAEWLGFRCVWRQMPPFFAVVSESPVC